jgi:phage terminase Nu1 subunit (DNA packaging protein)
MRVRITRNLGKDLPPFKEGEEHDVDDALAEKWLAEGLAELPPKKLMKDGKEVTEAEAQMTEAQAKQVEEALKHQEGVAKTERAKAKAAADLEAKAAAEKQKTFAEIDEKSKAEKR